MPGFSCFHQLVKVIPLIVYFPKFDELVKSQICVVVDLNLCFSSPRNTGGFAYL